MLPIINDQAYSGTMSFLKLANWKLQSSFILLVIAALVTSVVCFSNRYNGERWRIELFEAQHLVKYIHFGILAPTYSEEVVESEFSTYFLPQAGIVLSANKPSESVVEQELSRRVTQALVQLDLSIINVPFLDVFPPVSVELATPPKYVVISPRTKIEHLDGYLVKQDLKPEQIDEIEKNIELSGEKSAYAVKISGIATYPALIDNNLSYQRTIFAIAHEWIHHYLAFFKLGRIYFSGGTAMNETVADMAALEITDMVLKHHPSSNEKNESLEDRPFDLTLLQELRRDVDALLLSQEVVAAEELMSAKRLAWCKEFDWCPRKINQAYLAWIDQYSARDGSRNIVGEQLKNIRLSTGSLQDFLIVVREIDSPERLTMMQQKLVDSR